MITLIIYLQSELKTGNLYSTDAETSSAVTGKNDPNAQKAND